MRQHPLVPDAVLAGLLYLFLSVTSAVAYDPGWTHLLIGTAIYGCLAFRRVRPVESFVGVAITGLVQWATGVDLTIAAAGYLLSLYSISAYGPRWASRAGLVVGLVASVLAVQRYSLFETGSRALAVGLYGAAVFGVWALGDVRRVRQAYLGELVERTRQAERERDQKAQIAAADERARIAREMHDVIAHNLSVIVAQADGGRYAADGDPAQAKSALGTISDTGRSALAETRRLLGVLRSDGSDDDDIRAPQPGLERLPELVESYRSAGLTVDVEIAGDQRALPDGPSLAVYRAIQEALTNALKHAGPRARVSVTISYHDDQFEAAVVDDGRGAAAAPGGSGLGLTGMRERLAVYGGQVDAGPAPGGGWRVVVTVPIEQER